MPPQMQINIQEAWIVIIVQILRSNNIVVCSISTRQRYAQFTSTQKDPWKIGYPESSVRQHRGIAQKFGLTFFVSIQLPMALPSRHPLERHPHLYQMARQYLHKRYPKAWSQQIQKLLLNKLAICETSSGESWQVTLDLPICQINGTARVSERGSTSMLWLLVCTNYSLFSQIQRS